MVSIYFFLVKKSDKLFKCLPHNFFSVHQMAFVTRVELCSPFAGLQSQLSPSKNNKKLRQQQRRFFVVFFLLFSLFIFILFFIFFFLTLSALSRFKCRPWWISHCLCAPPVPPFAIITMQTERAFFYLAPARKPGSWRRLTAIRTLRSGLPFFFLSETQKKRRINSVPLVSFGVFSFIFFFNDIFFYFSADKSTFSFIGNW